MVFIALLTTILPADMFLFCYVLLSSYIGLFKAGISTSGTALCPWTFQEQPLEKTRQLAAAVGCNQQSTKDLVDCLQNRPARQIVESVRMFRPWLFNPFSPFGLVVEKSGKNPFLPDFPYALLERGEVQDLPWITSVTAHEGLYPAAGKIFCRKILQPFLILAVLGYALKEHYLSDLEKRWEELAPYVLDYWSSVPSDLQATVAQKAKDYYLHGKSISRETFPELIQVSRFPEKAQLRIKHKVSNIDDERQTVCC